MNPESANLLEQLRDIHGAPPAPWWPPAPGWWVLAAVLLFVLYLLGRQLQKRQALKRRRRELQAALDSVLSTLDPAADAQAWLSAVNRLFKRVAMDAFPETACAGYQGPTWAGFIERKLRDAGVEADLAALADGPYQSQPSFEPEPLMAAARQWIRLYG